MDPITAKLMSAAGGAAADRIYVDDVFSTFLYDGTGSAQTITNGIDLSGEGGMVWIKSRTQTANHSVYDTERGALKSVETNTGAGESTGVSTGDLTAFNSNGFSIGTNYGQTVNTSGENYCSWTFRKCPGFFDVVTYTGNGSDRDISHSLGSEPGSIWIKRTDQSESWIVYHRSLHPGGGSGSTEHFSKLELESSGGQFGATRLWSSSGGGEDHTSTTFHVSSHGSVNQNGGTFVAYIFAHDDQSFGDDGDEAIIKCGSYTGDGTTDGSNTVDLGFEPQWILTKRSDSSDNWHVCDVLRGQTTDGSTQRLRANTSAAESGNYGAVPTSSGFKLYSDNSNNGTFIYIAIRRPHKPPEAATECFDVFTQAGSNSDQLRPGTSGSGVTDLAWIKNITTTSRNWVTAARLTGNRSLFLNNDNAARTDVFDTSPNPWDQMSGTELNGEDSFEAINHADSSYVNFHFTRKPGFMDVVTYKGVSASDLTVSHNLGVVPELMIVYNLSENQGSAVYVEAVGNTKTMFLSVDNSPEVRDCWNDTSPTATAFTLGNDNKVNNDGDDHVAYLFATLPGISKIGSYTGTGSAQNIDCGFTNGARFIVIKRTDSDGHWISFDTARGINAGSDPILFLNFDITPVTGNNYVNPLNSGFAIHNTNQVDINASNGTYIFLAIA